MRMRAMSDSLWESRRMSKGRSLRVFVDLAPLSPDGGNGGVRVFVLRLLEALLKRPGAHEIHLLVKPEAEAVVAPLLAQGAVLRRLGPGLDVEEPRLLPASPRARRPGPHVAEEARRRRPSEPARHHGLPRTRAPSRRRRVRFPGPRLSGVFRSRRAPPSHRFPGRSAALVGIEKLRI